MGGVHAGLELGMDLPTFSQLPKARLVLGKSPAWSLNEKVISAQLTLKGGEVKGVQHPQGLG